MTPAASPDFEALVSAPDASLDLARIALALAADAYPGLDREAYVARIDAMAVRAGHSAGRGAPLPERLAALDRELFEVEGFAGNADAYYDPRNSFLNEVLDRRTGIPITLSVVYLEAGWRLGLALRPVSFPGHFLVVPAGPDRRLIDPFARGARLDETALAARLALTLGTTAEQAKAYLPHATAPVPRREVAARMLRNLKAIYANDGNLHRLLSVSNRMVALLPEDPAAVRDRGLVLAELECHQAAYFDLVHYLRLAPEADDAPQIRARAERLRPVAMRLN